MGRMTWHQATPQRLEPVGPDRDCGTRPGYHGGLVLRHRRWTRRTNLALSRLGRVWPTRTATSPATVLVRLSRHPAA